MKRALKILFTALTCLTFLNNMNIGNQVGLGLSEGLTAVDDLFCEEPTHVDSSSEVNCIEQNSAQDPIAVNWELLVDVESEKHYYKEFELEYNTPKFRKMQKDLDGKEIIIAGYVIPIDELGISLALSKYPLANCFFCGKASPASVLSLYPKKKGKRFKLDAFKKFKGTLHLNYDNPFEFYYILKDAEEI